MSERFNVPPERAGALLSVDLRALQNNWRQLADQSKPARCAAAVKADCYGLGLQEPIKALTAVGCDAFFVALPDEGQAVRALASDADIYILSGLLAGQGEYYLEHNLQPVLCTLGQFEEWRNLCRATGKKLPAALHVDTGINRLGLSESDVKALAKQPAKFREFELTLIISHLACGDEPANPMNDVQRQNFDKLREMLPDAPASLANSSGTFLGEKFTYDMVRPGIALYGGNPFAARANPMSAVAHLYAPLLQVRELEIGESVGYGATWVAHRPSKIGVFGVGYRDGVPRSLTTKPDDGPPSVFVAGHYAPIVGRISMDLITVDLTDVPAEYTIAGQRFELMGSNVTVDDIARWAGTIPYEIITRLGSRYARIYSSL